MNTPLAHGHVPKEMLTVQNVTKHLYDVHRVALTALPRQSQQLSSVVSEGITWEMCPFSRTMHSG